MSTAEQKARNREKQKRFQARHPNYDTKLKRKKREREELINPKIILPTSSYRTFELCDPRDPEKYPRVVAYCQGTPGAALWSVKDYSKSRWASWMRELDKMGLEPEERESPWNVGVNFGVNLIIVEFAVQKRIERICKIMNNSDFLLRHLFGRCQYPVGYMAAGNVFHFSTIAEASRDTGVTATRIKRAAMEISTIEGRTWFDD